MCSTTSSVGPTGDLTARARIRDAAILLFGRNGFDATSVRAIATEAGVSPGLVIHHFGNKNGLRHACDEYVLGDLVDSEENAAGQDLIGTLHRWHSDPEVFQPAFDYLTRAVEQESETADHLFDTLIARTELMLQEGVRAGTMHQPADLKATALLLAIQGLGLLTMSRQVGRTLGETRISAAILQRLTIPTLELYTHGIYVDDGMLQAARQAVEGNPS